MKKWFLIVIEVLVLIFSLYNLAFTGRIYPHVSVARINLGGKNESEAISFLSQNLKFPEKVILENNGQDFEITALSIDVSPNLADSARAAFDIHRTGNIIYDFYQRLISLFRKTNLGLRINLNENKLDQLVSVVAGQVESDAVPPSLKLVDGHVTLNNGVIGYKLDQNLLKAEVGSSFSLSKNSKVNIRLIKIDPTLEEAQANIYLKRGRALTGKILELKGDTENYSYRGQDLLNLIDPEGSYKKDPITDIVSVVSKNVNHDPENSVFIFEGGKVKEFQPSRDGVAVKNELLAQMIIGNLRTLEETDEKVASVGIPVDITPPKIKTGEVNNLGIKELLGRGVSYFAGSIPGRIHNINLAASKFKGVLVTPGDTLSFNETVSDISTLTGYKQAYIIKEGKTVLGDGGGVCQVSTTLFRATLNAGLPVIERTAHAYRVGYYEQKSPPGIDATVFGPTVDLKIKNDTPNYLLIQTAVDNQNLILTFEIYGTSDGRIAKISTPVTVTSTPPPPDVYQDDPTLPLGKIVQTEHKAWGGKITFNYTVKKNGEIIYQKTFVSNYTPWAAVYLRGTATVQ